MRLYTENNVAQCWSCQNNVGQDTIQIPYGSNLNKKYVDFAIPECKVTEMYMERVNKNPCPYFKQMADDSRENTNKRKNEP